MRRRGLDKSAGRRILGDMEASLSSLAAATAIFVGGHFVLSSRTVRKPMAARLGAGPWRGLYAGLWPSPAWARYLPLLVMPVAAVLAVAGMSTRNVTLVGGEAAAEAPDPAPGIMRVTRHPSLWAVALWALSHLPANGDAASLILMGGILVLAFGGMAHIDARRRDALGAAWGPIELTTSVIPFAAIASRRTTMDWAGIGWQRPAGGVAIYLALLFAHQALIGVSPLPG